MVCKVSDIIKEAKRALHAINLLKPYFTPLELKQLIISNYYSILYYNPEIWHIPTLNASSKRQLFLASSTTLEMCKFGDTWMILYKSLHLNNQRATPEPYLQYKHAFQLCKGLKNLESIHDWLVLNSNHSLTSRQTTFTAI